MNIEELTLKQIKEIQSLTMFNQSDSKQHPFIGKFVLCRCYSAGVHAGYLVSVDNDQVILKDSRRLWQWKGTGVALSGVANGELIGGKLDTVNPEIYLTGVIEIIPCTEKSMKSIYDFK